MRCNQDKLKIEPQSLYHSMPLPLLSMISRPSGAKNLVTTYGRPQEYADTPTRRYADTFPSLADTFPPIADTFPPR